MLITRVHILLKLFFIYL